MHKSEFPVEIQCARSSDEEWCRRTEHPIGLDENMQKLPLELYPEPEEGTEMHISDLIHKLANDGNVEVDFWIDDRFPFTGLDRRICRDCIFNKSITWEACKCDRLDKEEFRRRYIRYRCEYHKTTGTALSEYERKEKEIRDQKIIRSFIQSRLDYDPHALMDYDLRMLKDDLEYGVTYESIKNYKYFKGLVNFEPDEAFEKKVWEFNRLQNTIGYFIILPMELAHCRETYKPIRTHMAKFLCRLERCLCGNGRQCS